MFRKPKLMVVLGALLLGAIGAAPAPALDKGDITIELGNPIEVTGGPIPGNLPAATNLSSTPSGCTLVFGSTCDVWTATIVVPENVPEGQDFIVTLELHWDTEVVADTQLNDLDLAIYDTVDQNSIGQAATTNENPEILRRANLTNEVYSVVVFNASGVNVGYTLKARMDIGEAFELPFELLIDPDESTAEPEAQPEEATPPPVDYSALPNTAIPPSDAPLPEVAVVPDTDLASIGASAFEEALEGPAIPVPTGEQAAARPPSPVSGFVIFLWLGALPAALALLVFFLMRRRRQSAFVFSTARPQPT